MVDVSILQIVIENIALVFFVFMSRAIFIASPSLRGATSDTNFHIWFTNSFFRNHKSFYRKMPPSSVVDGIIVYPPVPHILLSFFPRKYIAVIGVAANFSFDVASSVLCYWIFAYSCGQTLGTEAVFSWPFLCALMFSTTPLLHPVNARLTGIGSRTLGPFLAFVYFVVLGKLLYEAFYFGVLILILLFILVVVSSQFAMQALILFSFVLSLILMNPVPAAIVVFAVLVSLSTNALGSRVQLIGKVQHLKWYLQKWAYPAALGRNTVAVLSDVFFGMRSNPVRSIGLLFTRVTPFILLFSLPVLWICLYLLWENPAVLTTESFQWSDWYYASLVLVSLLVFVLTSFKPFSVLGEAERYPEYVVPFLSFLFAGVAYQRGAWWLLLNVIILNLFVVLVNAFVLSIGKVVENLKVDNRRSDDESLVSYLEESGYSRCVTVPLKLSFYVSDRMGEKVSFYFPIIFQRKNGLMYTKDDCFVYDKIKPDVIGVFEKYKLDSLIIDIDYYNNNYLPEVGEIRLDGLCEVFRNNKFIIYAKDRP